MSETLQHLASVAMMEEKDSAKKGGGSIWERDELCVRYIIEEGKINMLLRAMNEYKKFQYGRIAEGAKDEETKISMKVFEQSLGIILRCSFSAVEALQTLDMNILIEHVATVLKFAQENMDSIDDASSQEVVVTNYLELLFKQIESLNNEDTVMKNIESNEVVPLVLKHFEKFGAKSGKDILDSTIYFLAYLMETESYQTHKGKYIVDKEDKARLVLLEARTKDLMANDQNNRKALRCLSDNIVRFK